jgi:hypothetical protein
LILAVVQVTATLFGDYRQIFHSDGALKSILAEQGAAEGRFLPSLWVYANGDLLFVGPLIASTLLRPWFGVSYFGNAAAGLLCYLYLLAAVFSTCRFLAPEHKPAALAGTALAAGGLGVSNFEFVIGQAAYPVYAALALSLFAMAAGAAVRQRASRHWIWLVLAFAGSALFCSANPIRGIATMLAPLTAGWLVGCLSRPIPYRERFRLLASPTVLLILGGGAAGIAIYYAWLLPSVLNYDAAARIEVATAPQAWAHALAITPAWFEYFRVGGPWATLDATTRLLQASVWAIAAALFAAPLFVVLRLRKSDPLLHVFSLIVLAAYGASFAALILSAVLFTGPIEMRYATFPIYGSICIMVVLAARLGKGLKGACILLAISAVGAISAPSGRHLQAAPHIADFGIDQAERMHLIGELKEAKVGVALAGYWNSYVLTVLSGGEVHAYPIGIGTQVSRFAHHAAELILHGSNGKRQAVILSPSDTTDPKAWSVIQQQLGAPQEVAHSGPFTVWIYDTDIASQVFGIGYAVSKPVPAADLHVDISLGEIPVCAMDTADCRSEVLIRNTGSHFLATAGSLPLRLGVQGLDASGTVIAWDLGRVDFPRPLNSNQTARAIVDLPDVAPPRVVSYQLCLLQEGIAWMCDRTRFEPNLSEGSVPAP